MQAEYGDCFILELKSGDNSVNVLIDGGPYRTFEKHLKPALQKLLLNGRLDLMVLSHIDNDHIIGLLDLLEEIRKQRESGTKEMIEIEEIWNNSFTDLLKSDEDPQILLGQIFRTLNFENRKEFSESLLVKGFQQGTDLVKLAKLLEIPLNSDFDELIVVNDKIKSFHLNNMVFHLLGPTKDNVDKLRKEWKSWIERKTSETMLGLVQNLDKSIPNLASISFMVQTNNKKILFTGDSLGQDIVDVLTINKMLDRNGKFYVDVLKIPHHGSDRNTSLEFFNIIHAEYYIISANGRDDNPSIDTLGWIIETGNTSKEPKKIVLTNMTPNVEKILHEYDQKKYNYEAMVLKKESHFITIEL